jgi:hypothetical protein
MVHAQDELVHLFLVTQFSGQFRPLLNVVGQEDLDGFVAEVTVELGDEADGVLGSDGEGILQTGSNSAVIEARTCYTACGQPVGPGQLGQALFQGIAKEIG